jgi:predicted DNA-binding transcriptional regulator YafY
MANTKNAQLRYRVLDRCFRNHISPKTFEELKDEINEVFRDLVDSHFEISDRTLREDIKIMRDPKGYNAPIVTRKMKDGEFCYYYADSGFSIFKSNLTDKDTKVLQSTIEMLGRYRGLPSTTWLEEVITSLEIRFDLKANRQTLVSFYQNTELKGLEHLSALVDATMNQDALDITYHSYRGNESTYTISPYYLKQYNARWFLFGLDNTARRIMNLALDRIVSFRSSEGSFVPNTNIDFNTYFDDIIGVTIPNPDVKKETITLRFTEARFPYVESKPIHPSQQIVDANTHTITISVRPNRELFQRLFSFIPDIEVISPEWIRKEVAEKLKTSLEKHF